MKRTDLENLVMEMFEEETLEAYLREAIAESIDYEDIASEIVGRMDIPEIIANNIEIPF